LEREDQIVLLRYLRSEYLSIEGMNLLLEHLGDSIHDPLVFDSLCVRLRLPVSPGNSSIASSGFALTSRTTLEFPIPKARSLKGIISYLTEKHGGNVHDKRIVTVISRSVWKNSPTYGPRQAADLASGGFFDSKDAPRQWLCWDFHEMLVRPTNYTLTTQLVKSWIVEGSLDGKSWETIDRQTDNQDFRHGWKTASFATSNPMECRFIHLTQTDRRHCGDDDLPVRAVEFFGTLSE
jgi:hypothetical protein